jgi:hypothetical protein
MTKAIITVYLQALGGKFLGPNAYNTNDITVTLVYSGGNINLPYQLIADVSDDGIISQGFTDGSSSFMPILSMPTLGGQNPTTFFLTPDANTIAASGQFALPATVEQALLNITIPTPTGDGPLTFSNAVILSPQQTAYRMIVIVPGLLLTPNTANPIADGVSVFVTMMCGCKVTTGLPTSFWSPSDFMVMATVQYRNGAVTQYPLGFNASTNNSLFSATMQAEGDIQSITYTAHQKSTGNYGTLVLTL